MDVGMVVTMRVPMMMMVMLVTVRMIVFLMRWRIAAQQLEESAALHPKQA